MSDTGDVSSHISDRESEEEGFDLVIALPNLNCGSCDSGLDLRGIEVVLRHFARDNDGRMGFDFRLSCGSCNCISSSLAGLDDRGMKDSGNNDPLGVGSGEGDWSST